MIISKVKTSYSPDISQLDSNVRLFAESNFRNVMKHNLVDYDGEIIADNQIHRFYIPGHKRGSKNGWYIFHNDTVPRGAFGDWKAGVSFTWHAKSLEQMDNAELSRYYYELNDSYIHRMQIRETEYKNTAKRAQQMWNRASPPPNRKHPYLRKKFTPIYNLRQIKETLLVPLQDLTGNILNLQLIKPDGSKFFLRGGRVHGLFSLLGRISSSTERVYLCEGWATAATLRYVTQQTVVAAMNAGNLKHVAIAIRTAFPKIDLFICADNDRKNKTNPGLTYGKQAADAVGATLVWPSFKCEDCECTDFNDLYNCLQSEKEQ